MVSITSKQINEYDIFSEKCPYLFHSTIYVGSEICKRCKFHINSVSYKSYIGHEIVNVYCMGDEHEFNLNRY